MFTYVNQRPHQPNTAWQTGGQAKPSGSFKIAPTEKIRYILKNNQNLGNIWMFSVI
jgi:hypothetical protein